MGRAKPGSVGAGRGCLVREASPSRRDMGPRVGLAQPGGERDGAGLRRMLQNTVCSWSPSSMWSLLRGKARGFHSHGALCAEPGTPLQSQQSPVPPITWGQASHRGLRLRMGQSRQARVLHPTQDAGIGLPPRSCGCFSSCFADIHEFYDFTLRSAPLQPPSPDARRDTARQQRGASEPGSAVAPKEPQNLPEVRATPARCRGAGPCAVLHQAGGKGHGEAAGHRSPASSHPERFHTSSVIACLINEATSLVHKC